MQTKTTLLVLISKPGLIRNSLLAYFRSLAGQNTEISFVEPVEFLEQTDAQTADVLIINEDRDAHVVDQILEKLNATQSRFMVIVNDVARQRELQDRTTANVLVWGLIRSSLEKFLADL